MFSLNAAIGWLIVALLLLVWLYVAARIMSFGVGRSWWEVKRKFGKQKRRKCERKEEING